MIQHDKSRANTLSNLTLTVIGSIGYKPWAAEQRLEAQEPKENEGEGAFQGFSNLQGVEVELGNSLYTGLSYMYGSRSPCAITSPLDYMTEKESLEHWERPKASKRPRS